MELAEALQRPDAYPFPVHEVGFRQTHISWVFLAGAYAYKVKKPVNLGFLDYTTLERRRFYCQEEVRLNRRLAPDVYLGVVPITPGPRVEGHGPAIEYAVKMRRLPEPRMLDRLLAAGALHEGDIDRLAQRLARFHAEAETGPRVERGGSIEIVRRNWQENFDQVQPYLGWTISARELESCRRFVDHELASPEVFEARLRHGRIRDCHGDLRAESVWMGEDGQFEVFDCIEFNERFRYGDVASEVAFLAMDLDWRGRPDLAWSWTDAYRRASGDEGMLELLPFYKCYRAFVRGKVESMAVNEQGFTDDERQARKESASQHFRLAELYTAQLAPVLILMCGQVGSGKTTVARGLASLLGLPLLSSDVVRKELAGLEAGARSPSSLDAGLYRPEARRAVYEELYRRASDCLRRGQSAIADATFGEAAERSRAVAAAERHGAGYFVLETVAPARLIRRRLEARQRQPSSASDAGVEVFQRTRSRFEPPSEIPADHRCTLDLAGGIAQPVNAAVAAVLQRAATAP